MKSLVTSGVVVCDDSPKHVGYSVLYLCCNMPF